MLYPVHLVMNGIPIGVYYLLMFKTTTYLVWFYMYFKDHLKNSKRSSTEITNKYDSHNNVKL
jgi:hypothetical protein